MTELIYQSIFSLLFTCLVIITLGTLIIVSIRKYNIFGEQADKLRRSFASAISMGYRANEDDGFDVLREWRNLGMPNEYHILRIESRNALNMFKAKLSADFSVAVLKSSCDISSGACSYMYLITDTTNGNKILMVTSAYPKKLRDDKERLVYGCISNSENVLNYADSADEVVISWGCRLIYGSNSRESANLVMEAYKAAELAFIEYPEESTNSTGIRRLHISKHGLTFPIIWQRFKNVPKELLNNLYMDFSIFYKGKTIPIKPSYYVNMVSELLINGSNFYMYGTWGTGKTTMLQRIQNQLVRSGAEVVNIAPADMGMLKKHLTELIGTFSEAVKAATHQGKTPPRLVICIDEAEQICLNKGKNDDISVLLELLDGSIKLQINCSVILIFNAEPKELNQALFRAGRLGVEAKLLPLNEEKARAAVKMLQARYSDMEFDEAEFEKLLANQNQLPDGTVYAPAGRISLADMMKSAFKPRLIAPLVEQIIKNYSKGSESIQDNTRPVAEAKPNRPKIVLPK